MRNTALRLAALLSVFCLLVLGFAYQHSSPKERYSPIVEQVQEKVVMITVPSIMERAFITFTKDGVDIHTSTVPVNMLGSGVFVTNQGHILTCAHVIDHVLTSSIIATLSNGTTVPAFIIYKDTDSDLALIKIAYKSPYTPLSSYPLRLGEEVIAVGNPYGEQFSTSHGIISHIGRNIGEQYVFTQIDTPINPGNSGGPLFNLRGELVGINARKYPDADGMGLAISPQTIKEFLEIFKGV